MSRQVCVSQDDPAHSDRDTTHYWELRETVRVMRTTARQRKEPRSGGAGLETQNNKLHKRISLNWSNTMRVLLFT